MALLAQGIAREQAFSRDPGSVQIVVAQPLIGGSRQAVFVAIGESLALLGEAIVPETLGEIARVELDGTVMVGGGRPGRRFEVQDIELSDRRRPQPEGLAV